jgi:acetyl-CoA carboxylase carboxyl transferase subunit alpha
VISPEGCASILWRSGEQKEVAAEALKLTAGDLKEFGVIDEIVPEPLGGAHRAKAEVMERLGDSLAAALARFDNMDGDTVRRERRDKFLQMGRNGLGG